MPVIPSNGKMWGKGLDKIWLEYIETGQAALTTNYPRQTSREEQPRSNACNEKDPGRTTGEEQ